MLIQSQDCGGGRLGLVVAAPTQSEGEKPKQTGRDDAKDYRRQHGSVPHSHYRSIQRKIELNLPLLLQFVEQQLIADKSIFEILCTCVALDCSVNDIVKLSRPSGPRSAAVRREEAQRVFGVGDALESSVADEP